MRRHFLVTLTGAWGYGTTLQPIQSRMVGSASHLPVHVIIMFYKMPLLAIDSTCTGSLLVAL